MSTIEDLQKFEIHDLKRYIDHNKKYGLSLTVGELKKLLNNTDIPDDTLILYENIGEEYINKEKENGWGVIPMKWETRTYDGEKIQLWSPCIEAFQIFKSEDENGDIALVLTAHY